MIVNDDLSDRRIFGMATDADYNILCWTTYVLKDDITVDYKIEYEMIKILQNKLSSTVSEETLGTIEFGTFFYLVPRRDIYVIVDRSFKIIPELFKKDVEILPSVSVDFIPGISSSKIY